MDAGGRLPEDLAAEQAYLAELRAQRLAEEREAAAARRAQLAAQGLLDDALATPRPDPLAPRPVADPPSATAAAAQPAISLDTLASLSPELIAQLPPEVRDAVLALKQQQPAAPVAEEEASSPPAPLQFSSAVAADPAAAAPARPAQESSEEELARREAEILARVTTELSESGSPLTGGPRSKLGLAPVRALDSLLGALFGRKSTW